MQQTVRSRLGRVLPTLICGKAGVLILLIAAGALLFSGCAPGEDVTTTATAPHDSEASEPGSSNLAVTAEQRVYLDALAAAGIHPSSDLMALSIGSYVCQAHVAGQSQQAVRDFVLPLVRGDVRNSHPDASVASMTTQVDDTTAYYIRIATERLC